MKLSDITTIQLASFNSLSKRLKFGYGVIRKCSAIRRQRVQLSLLTEAELTDIGLTDGDAKAEYQKRFYDFPNQDNSENCSAELQSSETIASAKHTRDRGSKQHIN